MKGYIAMRLLRWTNLVHKDINGERPVNTELLDGIGFLKVYATREEAEAAYDDETGIVVVDIDDRAAEWV